jgi:hypothetical protein
MQVRERPVRFRIGLTKRLEDSLQRMNSALTLRRAAVASRRARTPWHPNSSGSAGSSNAPGSAATKVRVWRRPRQFLS